MRNGFRERRLLARTAKQLAADDPQLAEAFRLWNARCCGVEPTDDTRVVSDRLLRMVFCAAVAACVLLAVTGCGPF
ncbi:DUF3040 domain-containing protein [Pseudonocardia sp.]|uniref:DUF3040 domain-containing protein n=1 Tax=Pseudonocardia sp. TaxID=60912 RepID=UPI002626B899|nr:DUF3040 domain-containing protein [Pseudonocardia sp.]